MTKDECKKMLANEIQFTYARSSGKGGQNVNKRDTKAIGRWVSSESAIDFAKIQKIIDYFKKYHISLITNNNEIVIHADEERHQERNKEQVITRFCTIVDNALKPVKKRVKTKVPRSVKEKGKEEKKRHSQKKQSRKSIIL